jgi:hypothetical protein
MERVLFAVAVAACVVVGMAEAGARLLLGAVGEEIAYRRYRGGV